MSIEIKAADLQGKHEYRAGDFFRIWCESHNIQPAETEVQAASDVIITCANRGVSRVYSSNWLNLLVNAGRTKSGQIRIWGYVPGTGRETDTRMDEEFCRKVTEYALKEKIAVTNPYEEKRESQYFSDIE
jgi:hypothetical protein